MVAKNVIGPDPEIHLNSNAAISLNRDIPYHVINCYFVCSCLDTIVKKYIKSEIAPLKNSEASKVLLLLQEVSKIPANYFPDEISKGSATVSVRAHPSNQVLLEYPGRRRVENRKPHIMNISVMSAIGIRSRTLKMPYFLAQA